MCDINKQTKLKKVTVYKVARKMEDGSYNSWIANVPIKLGKCPKYSNDGRESTDPVGNYISSCNYNSNMIGRCSGFKILMSINQERYRKLYNFPEYTLCILRLQLSGNIMKGTAKDISYYISDNEITYAGTCIDSIKEIDKNGKCINEVK